MLLPVSLLNDSATFMTPLKIKWISGMDIRALNTSETMFTLERFAYAHKADD